MGEKSSIDIEKIDCKMQLKSEAVETKVYPMRWVVLAIFVVYSASNAAQWIQYSIITDTITQYYNVSNRAVDMTSLIYMITYIPFIFPASYFLDKYGLRNAALVGGFGNCIGSWIKVLSASPDKFWLGFVGHTIVAISQTFILAVPSRLAAVWFGPDQVSSACSIGVFGNQLGVAIGFLFPPMLVPEKRPSDETGQGLNRMFYIFAIATSIILILIILFFKSEPPLPPSSAQAVQREAEHTEDFVASIKKLLTNRGYQLLILSYGINVGIFYAISTHLGRIVNAHFENSQEDGGRIGLTIVCAGMLGSVLCGIVLDKTRRFKQTTLGVYTCSLIGMIVFTMTTSAGTIIVYYVTAGLLGFFMTGYLPVGFEFAAELTYPEPEGTSAGLLNAVTQAFGILITLLWGEISDRTQDFWANVTLCIILAVGTFLTAIIPNDLRRQNAKF